MDALMEINLKPKDQPEGLEDQLKDWRSLIHYKKMWNCDSEIIFKKKMQNLISISTRLKTLNNLSLSLNKGIHTKCK